MCHPVAMATAGNRRDRIGINVSLTPELARFVATKVDTGTYASASEVVREGLRLLLEQELMREARLQELRDRVRVGLDQAHRGDLLDADVVFEELDRSLGEQERKRGRT